jgi:hypothetical protein
MVLICIWACTSEANKYDPAHYMSKKEQEELMWKTIRYSTKLAPHATKETRFDEEFDPYYSLAVKESYIMYYYKKRSDSVQYYLIARQARSITPMKEGIGAKIVLDDDGNLKTYEEVFRTWKMPEDTLKRRAKLLFDLMVKGKDLTHYTSKYKADQYIEFPDDRFYFDKSSRSWRDHVFDSVKINQ